MRFRIMLSIPLLALFGYSDTLTLRDGRTITGAYLGGNSRQIRMAVGDNVQSFEVTEVLGINFDSQATAQSAAAPVATPAPAQTATRAEPSVPAQRSTQARTAQTAGVASVPSQPEDRRILRPEPLPSAPVQPQQSAQGRSDAKEIPAGTMLVVRMIDAVDSASSSPGQTFRGSVDEPVVVGGATVIPRGADIVTRLVEVKDPNRLSGGGELTLDLDSIIVNGRTLNVKSQSVSMAGESRTKQSATVIGGTAALGAIIGAIAGGGRGAAIGAASGAGAGTAIQVLTSGPRVRVPSETRLTFTLQQPVRL